jgi:hypothetical protein
MPFASFSEVWARSLNGLNKRIADDDDEHLVQHGRQAPVPVRPHRKLRSIPNDARKIAGDSLHRRTGFQHFKHSGAYMSYSSAATPIFRMPIGCQGQCRATRIIRKLASSLITLSCDLHRMSENGRKRRGRHGTEGSWSASGRWRQYPIAATLDKVDLWEGG